MTEEQLQNESKPKRTRILGKQTVVTVVGSKTNIINIQEPLIKSIAEFANELGLEIYIVGGYVRDYYLHRPRIDYDFTIIGDAIEFAEKLAQKFYTKPILYPRFRTAMVQINGTKCEFVGTRKEIYQHNSRNPIVTEGTLEDDLKRRDFTINSMAVSLNDQKFGEVIDVFGGIRDLGLKILRTPLNPMITFNDDPLRMLRAIRFASQLDFRIDSNAYNVIKKISERIQIVSQERITEEFLKVLASPKPSLGLNLLFDTTLLRYIFPELYFLAGVEKVFDKGIEYAHKDIFMHTLQVVDNVAKQSDNIWLRFAALVHDIAKPKTKQFIPEIGWSFHGHEELGARMMDGIFRRMRLPLEHLEFVTKLVRLHQRPMALVDEGVTDSAVRRLAFHAGDALDDLFLLCKSDITTNNPKIGEKYLRNYDFVAKKVKEVQEKDKLKEFQSPVRGDEIMKICNIEPSPLVGMIKSAIEEAILDGIVPNEYESAKAYFLENKDEWLKQFSN